MTTIIIGDDAEGWRWVDLIIEGKNGTKKNEGKSMAEDLKGRVWALNLIDPH